MGTFRHFYMFMIKQVLAFKKMQATPISIPTSGTVFRGDLGHENISTAIHLPLI